MLSTANFPPNKALFDCSISRLQTCFCDGARKKLSVVDICCWPRLAAANYGFVQVVDGWMLVRPPAWASGPVTTLSLSQITGVFYQILRS